jgi:VIT1/CCC1 family predicted Fe2+/Mn2+ transporter
MRLIDKTEHSVVSEFLEKQLWLAKEQNNLKATLEIEQALLEFDYMVDLLSEEENND